MSDSIKVAVRVRPFNDREKGRGAKLVVAMEGKQTHLVNPNNTSEKPKIFTYDHSYWSHDGFVTKDDGYWEPTSTRYTDQVQQPPRHLIHI